MPKKKWQIIQYYTEAKNNKVDFHIELEALKFDK